MFLFCVAADPVIKKLAQDDRLQVIAYADDILIGHNADISPTEVIELCQQEFAKIGLTINHQKCKSTDEDQTIAFVGQEFMKHHPISRAEELAKKAEEAIKIIDASPLNLHQKFLMTSLVAISKVNFGPLIEQTSN